MYRNANASRVVIAAAALLGLTACAADSPTAATAVSAACAPTRTVLSHLGAQASLAAATANTGSGGTSTTTAFNATPIPAGDMIWFSSSVRITGPVTAGDELVFQSNGTTFNDGGVINFVPLPNAIIHFTSERTSHTVWNAADYRWDTYFPAVDSPGPIFLTAGSYRASACSPHGCGGNASPVTMSGVFYSGSTNVPVPSVVWDFSAAVYTRLPVNPAYDGMRIKTIGDNTTDATWKNFDPEGTPEDFVDFLTAGATGDARGNNYTGARATPVTAMVSAGCPAG